MIESESAVPEDIKKNFAYYCSKCKTPFDKLNPNLQCPFCESSEVTFNSKEVVSSIPEPEKVPEPVKKSFLDIVAYVLASLYIESVMFLRKEKYSTYLFLYLVILSLLLKLFFGLNDFIALSFGILFIIMRKK